METYRGHVRTPADAIILFEACRLGHLPRVQRRLSEKERNTITSGSIFVWDEREAGMRRWTDGKSWSASRVSGSFLTYREMEGKRGGSGVPTPTATAKDGNDDGPDGYRYKPDGLMKQSFSITTSSNQHLHLISYYSRSASAFHNLIQPSQDPSLRHIHPEKGMYPDSTVHDHSSIPPVTRAPMMGAGYSPPQGQPLAPPYAHARGPHHAPPYHGYAPAGWAPPSPLNTPPPHYQHHGYPLGYQAGQHHPQHALAQHSSYSSHGTPTIFDRAPPPLSQHSLPPPSQAGPRYSALPSALPPLTGAAPPKPEQLKSLSSSVTSQASGLEHRQDSVHPKAPEVARSSASPTVPATTSAPPTSGGSMIPSISTLISGAEAASHEHARRAASSSPSAGGLPPVRSLQDIPLHKLGFNPASDARALRDLDKATFRV